MTEDIKELLKKWYNFNNAHPCDDKRLYDIVIQTKEHKIDSCDFEKCIREFDTNISKNNILEYYKEYEWLFDFYQYIKSCEYC